MKNKNTKRISTFQQKSLDEEFVEYLEELASAPETPPETDDDETVTEEQSFDEPKVSPMSLIGIRLRQREDEIEVNAVKRKMFARREGSRIDISVNVKERTKESVDHFYDCGYIYFKYGKREFHPIKKYLTMDLACRYSQVISGEFDFSCLPDKPCKLQLFWGFADDAAMQSSYTIYLMNDKSIHLPETKEVWVMNQMKQKRVSALSNSNGILYGLHWTGVLTPCQKRFRNDLYEIYLEALDKDKKVRYWSHRPIHLKDDGSWSYDEYDCLYWIPQDEERTIRLYFLGETLGEFRIKKGVELPGDIRFGKIGAYQPDILDDMVGLEEVKAEMANNMGFVKINQARKEKGLPPMGRLQHTILTGNPGTGKTTLAAKWTQLLHQIGILSKGQLVVCNRASLVGRYIGESEKLTKSMIEKAKGGCLFIDEAYSLFTDHDDHKDYGRRVIDTLMPVLSDPESDVLVILAGYEREMAKFLTMNAGLASRFPIRLHFKDYSPDELMQIAGKYCLRYSYELSEPTIERLTAIFRRAVKCKDFGNGRFVYTLFDNFIIPNMGARLTDKIEAASVTDVELTTILPEDVPELEEVIRGMGLKTEASKPPIGFRTNI